MRRDDHGLVDGEKRAQRVVLLNVAAKLQESIDTGNSTVFAVDQYRARATRLSANNRSRSSRMKGEDMVMVCSSYKANV